MNNNKNNEIEDLKNVIDSDREKTIDVLVIFQERLEAMHDRIQALEKNNMELKNRVVGLESRQFLYTHI